MGRYIKWTDEYREKMEQKYHGLSVKTGLYNIGRQPGEHVISTSNTPNRVMKDRIEEMEGAIKSTHAEA